MILTVSSIVGFIFWSFFIALLDDDNKDFRSVLFIAFLTIFLAFFIGALMTSIAEYFKLGLSDQVPFGIVISVIAANVINLIIYLWDRITR